MKKITIALAAIAMISFAACTNETTDAEGTEVPTEEVMPTEEAPAMDDSSAMKDAVEGAVEGATDAAAGAVEGAIDAAAGAAKEATK